MSDERARLTALRLILGFSIVSTALHFSHNFVETDRYPTDLIGGEVIQVAILVAWPVGTAIALLGYWLYARRRYAPAHLCLLAYSLLGLSTLGHFLAGSPDIPSFWYATIFTDGLAGLAVAAFAAWSALTVGTSATGGTSSAVSRRDAEAAAP